MIDGRQTKKNAPAFEGFIPPTRNYFPMPNMWIDICAQIDNLAELKVIQYVLRHTWGYQEYDGTPKAITTDEFMHGRKRKAEQSRMDKGTGLSNRSVIDGLRRAVDHGYLTCTVNDEDKARISKAYALKMAPVQPDVQNAHTDVKHLHAESRCEASTQQLCQTSIPDMNNLHSGDEGGSQRSEKDTLDKHQEKNTRERQDAVFTPASMPTFMPDARSQDTTQADAHLNGKYPAARQTVACATDERSVVPAHTIRTPTDKASSAGREKPASTPGLSTSTETYPPACVQVSLGERTQSNKAAIAAPTAIPLSPRARTIFVAWCTLFKVEVDLTPANAQAAEKLVKPLTVWCSVLRVPVAELLREIMNWLYATDTRGYYKRGVKLFDVAREFEGWQSAREREMRKKTCALAVPTREEDPYSIAALLAAQNPGFFA